MPSACHIIKIMKGWFHYQLIWKLIRQNQTFSDAVARRVPCKLSAMQLSAASCATMSRGALSVFARSTTWTCPVFRPGNASKELLLFGHSTHKPETQLRDYLLVTNNMTCIQFHNLLHKVIRILHGNLELWSLLFNLQWLPCSWIWIPNHRLNLQFN